MRHGAFILATAYPYFPENTIHVVVIDPDVGSQRRGIILKVPGALFVAPDNGVLSYVIDQLALNEDSVPDGGTESMVVRMKRGIEVVSITDPRFWRNPVSPTFHGRDIFAPVAAGLSLGLSPYEFGEKTNVLTIQPIQKPRTDASGDVVGHVMHVDHFGNLVMDIRGSNLPPGPVDVYIGSTRINGISHYYQETEGLAALLGSSGYLEISLRNSSAAECLDAMVGDEVRVTAVS